jgi:hypothetical protein
MVDRVGVDGHHLFRSKAQTGGHFGQVRTIVSSITHRNFHPSGGFFPRTIQHLRQDLPKDGSGSFPGNDERIVLDQQGTVGGNQIDQTRERSSPEISEKGLDFVIQG